MNWRISVRDAKSGEPVEGGEGRIWGKSKDGHQPGNGLATAPQLGTYIGSMVFITAGQWEMSMQFRRDSTKPFARIDWMQEVRPARPLGGGNQ